MIIPYRLLKDHTFSSGLSGTFIITTFATFVITTSATFVITTSATFVITTLARNHYSAFHKAFFTFQKKSPIHIFNV